MPSQSLGNIGCHKLIQTHAFRFGMMLKATNILFACDQNIVFW